MGKKQVHDRRRSARFTVLYGPCRLDRLLLGFAIISKHLLYKKETGWMRE